MQAILDKSSELDVLLLQMSKDQIMQLGKHFSHDVCSSILMQDTVKVQEDSYQESINKDLDALENDLEAELAGLTL